MSQEYKFSRMFQVWAYLVSHGQLLLRSTKAAGVPTRIDILFKDVAAMKLPARFETLTISIVAKHPEELDPDLVRSRTFFRLSGPRFEGYVVAGSMTQSEDQREFDEPSGIFPT